MSLKGGLFPTTHEPEGELGRGSSEDDRDAPHRPATDLAARSGVPRATRTGRGDSSCGLSEQNRMSTEGMLRGSAPRPRYRAVARLAQHRVTGRPPRPTAGPPRRYTDIGLLAELDRLHGITRSSVRGLPSLWRPPVRRLASNGAPGRAQSRSPESRRRGRREVPLVDEVTQSSSARHTSKSLAPVLSALLRAFPFLTPTTSEYVTVAALLEALDIDGSPSPERHTNDNALSKNGSQAP